MPQFFSSPPRAKGAWRGGFFCKFHIHRVYTLCYVMSPFQGCAMLCRPFRAVLCYVALSGLCYVMSPFRGCAMLCRPFRAVLGYLALSGLKKNLPRLREVFLFILHSSPSWSGERRSCSAAEPSSELQRTAPQPRWDKPSSLRGNEPHP